MDRITDQQKSARGILTVAVRRFDCAASIKTLVDEQDLLAVEEPLQICAEGRDLVVTMCTPGNDAELAAGFLFTEGLIRERSDITSIECGRNSVTVHFAEGTDVDLKGAERNFYI